MRLHALLGVLAAISRARQTTAWDYQCWDCVTFRASLWLPFSKGDVQSRQWAVAASKQEHCPSAAWKSDFRTRHSARPRRHAHNRCPRAGCIYDEKPIKALFYSTLVVVIILGLYLILQCWRWSRPEPAPLRASSAAPPPEPEPVEAEIVPYPNR